LKKTIFILFIILTLISVAGCTKNPSKEVLNTEDKIEKNYLNKISIIDEELQKEVEANHSFDTPFVALDPYENTPLSAVVIFSTSEETSVNVRVIGHEEAYDIQIRFDKGKKHIIPVYGLYPGEENKVLLTLDDGRTKELSIITENIDETYKTVKIAKLVPEKNKDGLTFVSLGQKSSDGIIAAAYDQGGEMRWALKGEVAAWDIYKLKNGRLLVSSSEKHSDPYYTKGVREIDLMGKTYVEYIFPGGYHHGAFELPNGNLLVAAQKEESSTLEDVAYEINRSTGAIEKIFDLKDILPTDDGSSLSHKSDDWFHINSVWYDEKSNSVMLSGRNADAVVSIDYDTGSLRWILGNPEGWSKVDKQYFFNPVGDNFEWQYAQHGGMITPKGNVFLFDNGVFRAKKTNEDKKLSGDESYSRGVIYKIDEKNMTIEQVWQYGKELGSNWYSYYLGDVDYLSENHYLINSGGQLYDTANKTHDIGLDKLFSPDTKPSASIVEVLDDEIIFEMVTDFNIYAAERINIYKEINSFDLYTSNRVLDSKIFEDKNTGATNWKNFSPKISRDNEIDNEIQNLLKDESFTFEAPLIIQDPYDIAPLTALAVFNTEKEVTIGLTILGDTPFDTFKFEFPKATEHRIPIIGLYPNRENTIILEQINQGEIKERKELKIKTEPLPEKLHNMVEVTNSKGKPIEGITIVSGGDVKTPFAFDSSGEIRWYLNTETEGHGYFPLSDGKFIIMSSDSMITTKKRQYATLLYNMDFLGKLHRDYFVPKGAHHEVIEKKPDGNLLVLSNSMENHVEDSVVEIDRITGKVIKELKLGDIIKDTYDDILDWAHINSISYNIEDDSIILSVRNVSAAVKIDWSTDELKWILSDPRIWKGTNYEEYVLKPEGPTLWHYEQHTVYEEKDDIDSNPETLDIIMFDNRVIRNSLIDVGIEEDLDKSSVTQYAINEKNGTVRQVKRFPNTLAYITSNYQLFYDKDRIIANHASARSGDTHWGEIYKYKYSTGEILRSYKIRKGFYRAYKQNL